MNIRVATKITREGQTKYIEVSDNCWMCPNSETRGYFDVYCRLTDEYVGDRCDSTNPIPESCPLPSLLEISQKLGDDVLQKG